MQQLQPLERERFNTALQWVNALVHIHYRSIANTIVLNLLSAASHYASQHSNSSACQARTTHFCGQQHATSQGHCLAGRSKVEKRCCSCRCRRRCHTSQGSEGRDTRRCIEDLRSQRTSTACRSATPSPVKASRAILQHTMCKSWWKGVWSSDQIQNYTHCLSRRI